MSHARALGLWQQQLHETLTVFRFRARRASDDVDECMAHWPDPRSARFTLMVIGPQRDVLSRVAGTLERFAEQVARASSAADSCEQHVASLRAELESVQQACRDAVGAASRALQDAGVAQSAAAEVEASASGLVSEAGAIWLPA